MKLLTMPKVPDDKPADQVLLDSPEFKALYDQIIAIRELSHTLGKGHLESQITERGYILSNMKALQANLRHLTWQTKKISEGDYSQKVDFLGDFSDAFNMMTATLRAATSQLKDIARLDTLTKVPNRLSLEEFLENSFNIAKRDGKSLFIFSYDIDLFKKVNDTYGHSSGDLVLIQFSEIISKLFRATDIFARYGGEEFVAVLPDISLETAMQIAERARSSVEKADFFVGEDQVIKMTVSIGISNIHLNDESHNDILKRSDEALYEAKESGRNCLRVKL